MQMKYLPLVNYSQEYLDSRNAVTKGQFVYSQTCLCHSNLTQHLHILIYCKPLKYSSSTGKSVVSLNTKLNALKRLNQVQVAKFIFKMLLN